MRMLLPVIDGEGWRGTLVLRGAALTRATAGMRQAAAKVVEVDIIDDRRVTVDLVDRPVKDVKEAISVEIS